ncbi:hypothetical protein ES707_05823 [subsurface metagenome]
MLRKIGLAVSVIVLLPTMSTTAQAYSTIARNYAPRPTSRPNYQVLPPREPRSAFGFAAPRFEIEVDVGRRSLAHSTMAVRNRRGERGRAAERSSSSLVDARFTGAEWLLRTLSIADRSRYGTSGLRSVSN